MNKDTILQDIIGHPFRSTLPDEQVLQILDTFMEDQRYHQKYCWIFNQDDKLISYSYKYMIHIIMKGYIKINDIHADDISFDITVQDLQWLDRDQMVAATMKKEKFQTVILSPNDIWKISGSAELKDYNKNQIQLHGSGYLMNR